MNKLKSVVLCLLITAMFVGCGDNSQSSNTLSEIETSTINEVTETAPETETKVEIETTTVVTEQEPQAQKSSRGQNNIIPYIYLGMSGDEVVSRTGVDYGPSPQYSMDMNGEIDNEIDGYLLTCSRDEADIFNLNPYIKAVNPDMEYCLNFNFSKDDILFHYDCQIGAKINNDYTTSYTYDEAELTEMYKQIYDILCEWYGEPEKDVLVLESPGVIDAYEWYDTEFGNI